MIAQPPRGREPPRRPGGQRALGRRWGPELVIPAHRLPPSYGGAGRDLDYDRLAEAIVRAQGRPTQINITGTLNPEDIAREVRREIERMELLHAS